MPTHFYDQCFFLIKGGSGQYPRSLDPGLERRPKKSPLYKMFSSCKLFSVNWESWHRPGFTSSWMRINRVWGLGIIFLLKKKKKSLRRQLCCDLAGNAVCPAAGHIFFQDPVNPGVTMGWPEKPRACLLQRR